MRKVREILRLRFERGLSQRQISASTGVSKGAIGEYMRRAAAAGVTWEIARALDDSEVEARLFRYPGRNEPPRRVPIDLPWVHRELRRTGMTLQQLWIEYRDGAAAGLSSGGTPYGYSQFCDLYADFRQRADLSMRQVHRAGEKIFIDYSGKKPRIWSSETGEAIEVELFVAVLGASNYTFAEATRTQRLEDFCASTVRALEFFGGVPKVAVPDQLRSAVSGPDRYDPEINPTYAELAQHYDLAIVPARPGKPRDKAKVEGAVLVAQRWILACLRNRTFFTLDDLNIAIAELVEKLWGPRGSVSTIAEHRPRSHREYGAWPPSRIIGWAASIGPASAALIEQILLGRREPESAYRSCMALIRRAKAYDSVRFDAACQRAIAIGSPNRKSVLAILSRGLDAIAPDATDTELPLSVVHENVRGGDYYDRKETDPS
jgi:transposase